MTVQYASALAAYSSQTNWWWIRPAPSAAGTALQRGGSKHSSPVEPKACCGGRQSGFPRAGNQIQYPTSPSSCCSWDAVASPVNNGGSHQALTMTRLSWVSPSFLADFCFQTPSPRITVKVLLHNRAKNARGCLFSHSCMESQYCTFIVTVSRQAFRRCRKKLWIGRGFFQRRPTQSEQTSLLLLV